MTKTDAIALMAARIYTEMLRQEYKMWGRAGVNLPEDRRHKLMASAIKQAGELYNLSERGFA